MRHEVPITGVTVAIDEPRPDGTCDATIQLYDGGKPITGATITRAISGALAARSQPGDRWTVALQREVTL